LTQRLGVAQDAAGVPPLVGFRDEPSKGEFHLVFQIDQQMSGSNTLLRKFRHTQVPFTLNFRMNLCACLAEAILYVHCLSLVSKNVRPENILLVLDDQESTAKLFLLGCLLEILTWKPLLNPNEKRGLVVSPEFGETFKQLGYDDVRTRSSRIRSENDKSTHYPLQVQKVLIALAQSGLPIAAGPRMAGIVDSCLTSLDSEAGLGRGLRLSDANPE